MRRCLLPVVACLLLACAATAHADVQVTVTALPTIPGLSCGAIDINTGGDVLVVCFPLSGGAGGVSYVWSHGVRTDINASCADLNDARQIACNAASGPFLWQNGAVTSLSGMQSVGALNDLGEVFGTASSGVRALRRSNGTIVTVTAGFFPFVAPNALNNLSQVIGRPLAGGPYATVGTWSPTAGYVVSDLGVDLLTGVNDTGQITAPWNNRAWLFTPGQGWQHLPNPPGFPSMASWASSVNAAGQVTGYAADGFGVGGVSRAVFWISRASAIDLGEYQSMNTQARASNQSGQVVGSAVHPTERDRNVPLLWTVTNVPTPLPQPGQTDVTYTWVPTDGSAATGRMTVSAAPGPFSVAANRITSLQFSFTAGTSVQLVEGVESTGRPVMSFDGTGIDSGTVRLRRGAYPVDVLFSFRPDQLGDEAAYDPLGQDGQAVVRRGRWIREGQVPAAAVTTPRGVLGVIDINPIVANDPFGGNNGIAFDPARNRFYVTRGAHNPLVYIVSMTGALLGQIDLGTVSPGYVPESVTYEPATDRLFVFAVAYGSSGAFKMLEMTASGTLVREIPLPGFRSSGMVRGDGIWLVRQAQNGFQLDRYSLDGAPIEAVPLAESFPNGSPTVSTAFQPEPDGFLLLDPSDGRIVRVSRQGATRASARASMLDADARGYGGAVAVDPLSQNRMFLLTRGGYIFELAADFMDTRNVTSLLQLTGTSTSFSSKPSPAGPAGSYTIRAQFQNTSTANICSVFFVVTELTVNGRRLVDQLEVTTLTSTGQQLQGFGEQLLGHIPVNLPPGATQEFAFKIDLGVRQPFNFFVDAWGQPIAAGIPCDATLTRTTLVGYSATAAPMAPWVFVSNGPAQETSQHSAFVQDGILHLVDDALMVGNTLGYYRNVPFDPSHTVEVEFRARVLSGQSALGLNPARAPFEVWLQNGSVRADLSVGPNSVTSLGRSGLSGVTPKVIMNQPIDGTNWHVYRYRLSPTEIQWWADDVSLGSAPSGALLPAGGPDDRRINIFITSAAANVELEYLTVVDIKPQ